MATAAAAQEATFLRSVLDFVKGTIALPTVVLCDNLSAMSLVNNPVYHQRSKHIDIRYHYSREAQLKGRVRFVGVKSERNCADILTKALGKNKVRDLSLMLGLLEDDSMLGEGERRSRIARAPNTLYPVELTSYWRERERENRVMIGNGSY